VITACTEETNKRSLDEKFTAYSNQNTSVIFSGKINLKAILENSDYRHIPKINKLISSELRAFSSGIAIDSGLYFSVEELFQSTGLPSTLRVFATIKNKDSIVAKIASLGLLLEHTKALDYAIGPKFSIGIQEDIFILSYQENRTITAHDFNKLFLQLNKQIVSTSKSSTPEVAPIQFTTHIHHLYSLYEKNISSSLSAIQHKELQTLLKDASLTSTFTFESGGITIDTKHRFSTALKKRLFFNETSRNTNSRLTSGKPTAGLSVHFHPLKIQTLIEDFYPDFFQQLASMHGNIALGMMALGNKPITNLFGGELAFMYFGNSDSHSIYLSLGEQGKSISELTRSFFATNPFYQLTIHENEIRATSKNHISDNQQLGIPPFANDFGTHGIDFFIDISHYASSQPYVTKDFPFLEAIAWVKLSVNNESSRIRIQGKDSKIGILKQIANVYLNKLNIALGNN